MAPKIILTYCSDKMQCLVCILAPFFLHIQSFVAFACVRATASAMDKILDGNWNFYGSSVCRRGSGQLVRLRATAARATLIVHSRQVPFLLGNENHVPT